MTHIKQRAYECLRLASFAIGLASCAAPADDDPADPGAPDAAPAEVDPTGNWSVRETYDAACDRPPLVEPSTFTVTRGPAGYAIAAAGATATGALTCAADGCTLAGMFAWSASAAQFEQTVTMTLDAHGAITGRGTELVVDDAGTCGYAFTVAGDRT